MRSVATKTLHDYRKQILWWAFALAFSAVIMMAVYPSVKESAPELADYIENMPDYMKAMFGMEGSYTSPAGYLNSELFAMMLPMCFAAFAMGVGSRSVAGEEDKQTLDLLLSTPITRGSLLLQKTLAMVADTAILVVVLWLGLWLGGLTVSFDMSAWRLLEGSIAVGIIGLVYGTFSMLWGCWRGGRGAAIGVSAALLIASYLLYTLANVVDALEPWRWLSPFYWYSRGDVITNGMPWGDMAVLLGVSAVLVWMSVLAFDRRDLHA